MRSGFITSAARAGVATRAHEGGQQGGEYGVEVGDRRNGGGRGGARRRLGLLSAHGPQGRIATWRQHLDPVAEGEADAAAIEPRAMLPARPCVDRAEYGAMLTVSRNRPGRAAKTPT